MTKTPESLDAADDSFDGDRGESSPFPVIPFCGFAFSRPKPNVALVVHRFEGFFVLGSFGDESDFCGSVVSDLRRGLADNGRSRFSFAALCWINKENCLGEYC